MTQYSHLLYHKLFHPEWFRDARTQFGYHSGDLSVVSTNNNMDEVTIAPGKKDNQLLFRIQLLRPDPNRDYKLTYKIVLTTEHDSPSIEDPRWAQNINALNELIRNVNTLSEQQRQLKSQLDQQAIKIQDLQNKYNQQQQQLQTMQNQINSQAVTIQQLQQAAWRPRTVDPISVVLSNGDNTPAMGFQVIDPKDYVRIGPYRGVSCISGDAMVSPFFQEISNIQDKVGLAGQRWPQKFEATIKPNNRWCEVYSAIDGGLSHTFTFNNNVDNRGEVFLEVYRFAKEEIYHINCIEVFIFVDEGSIPINQSMRGRGPILNTDI